MNNQAPTFAAVTAAIRELRPPRRHNKHGPRFKAQCKLQELTISGPVELSEAEWRAIPWPMRATALKRLMVPKGRAYYTFAGFVLAGQVESGTLTGTGCTTAALMILRWLRHQGWTPPRVLPNDSRGRGKGPKRVDRG